MGSDATYDLAVLKVDASAVPAVISIGKSGELKPGQTVIAIGNPLGQFENSVTRGVVSSLSRLVPVDTDDNGQADSMQKSFKRMRPSIRELRWRVNQ